MPLTHFLSNDLLNIQEEKAIVNFLMYLIIVNNCISNKLKLLMHNVPFRAVRKSSIEVCIQDTTLISFGTHTSTIHTELFAGLLDVNTDAENIINPFY